MPMLVAGTLARGPPVATVSCDVSLCPTWKQRPHSTYYSRWSAIVVSRFVSFPGPSRPRLMMERGRQELRVAANRASNRALDQKLSRPKVDVSGGRIDTNQFFNQLSAALSYFHRLEKKGMS
ncbi:hypothetical protein PIB30_035664 [Stylosanthes scabra]|uniref:Uncharacterized protein n=1 Tax=Stylosanthes scabra TaxID=79078 RepID=A0ABU6SDG5_9FABA|nr:hypothetical protein [Stylosanthes scabra]